MKTFFTLLILLQSLIIAKTKHPLTIDDLWGMKRIGTVNLSPDGKTLVFDVVSYNMDENTENSDIYLVNTDGSDLCTLKNSEKMESKPVFLPSGGKIAYLVDNQVHTCNLDGSDDIQLTNIYTGVDDFRWSHDGKKLLLTSSVYPDCGSQNCNKKISEEKIASKVEVQVLNHLMYRYWNRWLDGKRSHLFLFDAESKKYYDLNYKMHNDVPPLDLGSENDFNFSPDDKEISYTMNPDTVVATNTNNEIYSVNISDIKKDGAAAARKISQSGGTDRQPVYLPEGKFIAFTSMLVADHESAQSFLVLYNRSTGKLKNLTVDFDRSVDQIKWSHDSKTIYFTTENEIFKSVYMIDINSGKIKIVLKDHSNTDLIISPDNKAIYFKQQRSTQPYEIFSMDLDKQNIRPITQINHQRLANLEMIPIEAFWTKGAEGKEIQSILVKPPFFDPSKKYPLIFLIHGGPQDHWEDDFHYRWNTELFASRGYIVIAPNPTGSTGYGQEFSNTISKDWGGRPYKDLMAVYDYSIKNFGYIDPQNTFAAGASYGGYMINWIEGHTDRFNALVCHDEVFNTVIEWGTTEELWFPEWELKGTPWTNRDLYEKWNPQRFIQNAKTPMLIIHGVNDYRIPEEQAFQLFTCLQRLGVESRLLLFTNEYHFVVKPQDARF